mgnify:FL=1|jgi:hypothetical protein
MPGVIHCMHEHFFPEKTTSPILHLHLGQFNLASFYCEFYSVSHSGLSMKYELHSAL